MVKNKNELCYDRKQTFKRLICRGLILDRVGSFQNAKEKRRVRVSLRSSCSLLRKIDVEAEWKAPFLCVVFFFSACPNVHLEVHSESPTAVDVQSNSAFTTMCQCTILLWLCSIKSYLYQQSKKYNLREQWHNCNIVQDVPSWEENKKKP